MGQGKKEKTNDWKVLLTSDRWAVAGVGSEYSAALAGAPGLLNFPPLAFQVKSCAHFRVVVTVCFGDFYIHKVVCCLFRVSTIFWSWFPQSSRRSAVWPGQ